MSKKSNIKGGIQIVRAEIDVQSIDAANKRFEVVFATENPILRFPYWSEERFEEVLVCTKAAIVAERLDAGVVPLLDTHNTYTTDDVYGIVRSWKIVNGECRAIVEYSKMETKAEKWKDIEAGVLRSISVGAKILQYERVPHATDPKGIPTYRAVKWEPTEISLVPVPADYKSSVRGEGNEEFDIEITNYKTKRAMLTQQQLKELRTSARAAGMDDDAIDSLIARCISETPITLEAARAEVSEFKPTPAAAGLTAADVARAATEERERGMAIRTAVRKAQLDETVADDMITRNLTLDVARGEILDKMAERSGGPANNGSGWGSAKGDERDNVLRAMTEGLMHRAQPGSVDKYNKLEPKEGDKHAVNQRMDAKSHDYKHMSLLDISRALLTASGVPGVQAMSANEVAKRAIDTTDLPDLFTSVVSRFMRLNYEAVVPEWMMFSRSVSANDFRVKTGIKFDQAVTFDEIAEDGEYKDSTMMSNEKATLQLKTYGRTLSITRKTIINDDMNILVQIPSAIGLGARQFQSKKVWGLITGNATCPDGNALFSAAHGNLGTGANKALIGDDSLNAATVAMSRQKSPQGNELDVKPRYLLVPPELMTSARKLLKGINPTKVEDVNLWDFLEPFKNVYFTDTKAWYVVADLSGTTCDGIVHSYLSGQEGLFTESFVDRKTDKVVIKARMDFAASVWGHQGWYKNEGLAPGSGA